jgi:hypothetical protein
MLLVGNWSTVLKELDFSWAELPNVKVHSIHVDGELLCNAYELTEWEADSDRMQLIICDHCGTIQCQPGGWVTFRQGGEAVFVLPLFSEIISDDQWEYAPPYIIRKRGALLFECDVYAKFRETFPKFPRYESIPSMTYREALRTFQLEVPGRILGDIFYSPIDVKRLDLVLAASEGDSVELAEQVGRIFDNGLQDERVAIIRHPEPNETAVRLYVDLPEIPEWNVFWKGKTRGLYLSPKHRLEIIEGSEPSAASEPQR